MSWASRRVTSRAEDEAYCLLGLFNVNIPIIYGEGKKAFQRLLEEIVKQLADNSIFAWELPLNDRLLPSNNSLFASSPRAFSCIKSSYASEEDIIVDGSQSLAHELTQKDLLLSASLVAFRNSPSSVLPVSVHLEKADSVHAILGCSLTLNDFDDLKSCPVIRKNYPRKSLLIALRLFPEQLNSSTAFNLTTDRPGASMLESRKERQVMGLKSTGVRRLAFYTKETAALCSRAFHSLMIWRTPRA